MTELSDNQKAQIERTMAATARAFDDMARTMAPPRNATLIALRAYLLEGQPVGSFLGAVLCNDLLRAAGAADDVNRRYLWEWAGMLHNAMPTITYGSPEKIDAWIGHGGYRGYLTRRFEEAA